jgi:hypothetical protein
MSGKAIIRPDQPVDAVILWVDGNDPELTEKRNSYHKSSRELLPNSESEEAESDSNYELEYCLYSILKFAPFIRNIFIVTDGQEPALYKDLVSQFQNRAGSIKIVDHKEIYRGYETSLPTFNSASLLALIWRIEGLSENFVYFNDDVVLIRDHKQEEWFIGNRPVLRGKWLFPPYKKIIWNRIKMVTNRYIAGNRNYQPRHSFYLRQWKAAYTLGFRLRYFFHCHTPHPLNRIVMERIFEENREEMEKTISCRFRSKDQLLMSSMAYHKEILEGNINSAALNQGYFHPFYSNKRLARRVERCKNDDSIKSVCIQSMERMDRVPRENILSWLGGVVTNGEFRL